MIGFCSIVFVFVCADKILHRQAFYPAAPEIPQNYFPAFRPDGSKLSIWREQASGLSHGCFWPRGTIKTT
jgi:hypothetical protein